MSKRIQVSQKNGVVPIILTEDLGDNYTDYNCAIRDTIRISNIPIVQQVILYPVNEAIDEYFKKLYQDEDWWIQQTRKDTAPRMLTTWEN